MMIQLLGIVAFVGFFVVYGLWVEGDKAERRRNGLPRRKYGVGVFDADVTSHTYTHKMGDSYYSTTYTRHQQDE